MNLFLSNINRNYQKVNIVYIISLTYIYNSKRITFDNQQIKVYKYYNELIAAHRVAIFLPELI